MMQHMDAYVKLLSFLLLVTAVIGAGSFAGYILLLLLIILLIGNSGLQIKKIFGGIRQLWLFFIVITAMNAFLNEGESVIVSWWIFHLTQEGILQGLQVVIRIVFIMILGNLFTMTTTPLEITAAFGSLLYPLRWLKVPVQDVAMILGVAIQFIPTFIEEASMIRKAQTARGARFESKKLRERAASLMPLIIPMFLSAFRRADELSIAMEARGYRKGRNGIRKHRVWKSVDVISIGVCLVAALVEIIYL